MITLVMGAMYSGKTTELIRRLERLHVAKKSTILLRPKIDTRDFLIHSKKDTSWLREAFVTTLHDIDISEFDAVGVDEGQFMNYLPEFCKKYANEDKQIIISALSATSEAEMFDPIVKSIPYCDKILKLNAVCTGCGSEYGSYTHHLAGRKSEKVKVGGADEYTALCARCYYARNNL